MRVRATLSFAVKVAPEGAAQIPILLDTMYVWREAVRHALWWCLENKMWSDEKKCWKSPSLARAHGTLYCDLRDRYGLPARLALDAIRQARWIADGWLANPNRGRRPVIRRLWLVLTPHGSYTLRGRDEVSILTLDGRKTYGLRYVERWHGQYDGWEPREARLVLRDGRLWFKLVVEREIPLIEPQGTLGVDVNYTNVTLSDGTRVELRAFKRAHGLKIEAERIQKGHRRSWRYIKAVRRRIRALGARARNIILDACRKAGLEVARHAHEARRAVVLEDLTGLKEAVSGKSRVWRMRLALWAYRELQRWIEWKSRLYEVPVLKVRPEGTSSTCPTCGSKLRDVGNRHLRCPVCGLEEDRDMIGALNLGMRGAQATLMAPDADEAPISDEGEVEKLGALVRDP